MEAWKAFGYESELDQLINELPENRPLYKDSGIWQIRSDDMEDVLFEQDVNESFEAFIRRCHSVENYWTLGCKEAIY